jgi:hypothetical protein
MKAGRSAKNHRIGHPPLDAAERNIHLFVACCRKGRATVRERQLLGAPRAYIALEWRM